VTVGIAQIAVIAKRCGERVKSTEAVRKLSEILCSRAKREFSGFFSLGEAIGLQIWRHSDPLGVSHSLGRRPSSAEGVGCGKSNPGQRDDRGFLKEKMAIRGKFETS
jgi:hypothetical protein